MASFWLAAPEHPRIKAVLRFRGARIVLVAVDSNHSITATADSEFARESLKCKGCLGLNDEDNTLVLTQLNSYLRGGDSEWGLWTCNIAGDHPTQGPTRTTPLAGDIPRQPGSVTKS